MKKLDIVAIIFVIIIGVSSFLIYFDRFTIDTSAAQLEIYYKSTRLDEPIFLSKDTKITYHIESIDNKSKLRIERKDHATGKEVEYVINEPQKLEVHHTIEVSYYSIRITEASCEGQDCIRGFMNYENTVPIICIVGISVVFNKYEIILGVPR